MRYIRDVAQILFLLLFVPLSHAITVSPTNSANGSVTVSGMSSLQPIRKLEVWKSGSLQSTYGPSTSPESFAVNGLPDGVYSFKVLHTCVPMGWCSWSTSNTVSATVANRPGVPSSITVPSVSGTTSVSVSWGAASGAVDYYELQKKKGTDGWVGVTNPTIRSYTVSGLTEGDYLFRVRACNKEGSFTACSSSWKTSSLVKIIFPPSIPSSITVQNLVSNKNVTWGTSTGTVTKYVVEQKINTGSWLQKQSNLSYSYPASGIQRGNTYYFRVKACNDYFCSNGYRTSGAIYVPYLAPDANIEVQGVSSSEIGKYSIGYNGIYTISWSTSGVVGALTIEESEDGGNSWHAVIPDEGNTASYNKPGNYTDAPIDYLYRIQACNVDACSAVKIITASVLNYPRPGGPGAISLLSGPTSDGNFTIQWGETAGPVWTHYEVQERKLGEISWGPVSIVGKDTTRFPVSGKAIGTSWQYHVQTCNTDAACSGYTSPFTVTIPEPDWAFSGNETTVIEDLDLLSPLVPTHQNVGTVAGAGSVDGGASSYNIPVTLPPGRKGMQPSIALNYSSQNGNGPLGMGWALFGISKISRCPQTVAQDGRNLGVQYSATNDRLCLDGQRLIVVAGTYGASGSEYRTEMDTFTRITQNGGLNGSVTWFKAELKNGRVRYYGYDASSRHVADGVSTIKTWAITKEIDRTTNKNSIIYAYGGFGKGELLLTDIYYTGNDSSQGDRWIQFSYESRSDKRGGYLAGGLTEQTVRLNSIAIHYQNNIFKEYTFGYLYSAATKRSLLDRVEECGFKSEMKICLPKTQFQWQNSAISYAAPESLKLGGLEVYSGVVNIEQIVPHGDIDGNGSTDFPGYSTNAEQEVISNNNLSGYETCHFEGDVARHKCIEADFDLDGRVDPYKIQNNSLWVDYSSDVSGFISTGISINIEADYGRKDSLLFIGDMDGDGYPDVVVNDFGDGRAKVNVYRHSGNVSSISFAQSTLAQINYTVYKVNGYPVEGKPYMPTQSAAVVGDISGNGLPDIVISETYSEGLGGGYSMPLTKVVKLNKSSPNNFIFQDVSSPFSTDGSGTVYRFFNFFIDVNGDTLPDYLAWHSGTTYLHLNLGGGNFGPAISIGQDAQFATRSFHRYLGPGILGTFSIPKYFESFRSADINGDGKAELLLPGQRLVTGCSQIQDARDGSTNNLCGDALYGERGVVAGSEYPTQLINAYFYDDSIYRYDAIFFDQQENGGYQARRETTDIVGSASQMQIVDLFGDGLSDIIFNYGGRSENWIQNPGSTSFGANYGAYIVRNYGAGNQSEGYEPYDVLIGVENGLGVKDEWHYRPLASGDSRYHSALKPFYEPDFDYLDNLSQSAQEDHFHFTSSMYVVAEHRQSNGVGGVNTQQFRYKGALYNNKGRGFQGFRSIIVEDLVAEVETQRDFHQIFPLAGKPFKTRKWELEDRSSDSSSVKAFEETTFEWQFWAMGGQGSPVVVDALTDDWSVSANDPYFVGPKTQSTVRRTLSSRAEMFTQSQSSTFDEWGNVLVSGQAYSEPGGKHVVSSTTDTQYVAADQTNWWIDKPLKQTVTKYAIQNGAGVSIDSSTDVDQTVVVDYLAWDSAARKPKSIKTTPSSGKWAKMDTLYNSYGLPTTVTTTAEGEAESRSVTTGYSSDGYFPRTVTNALGHLVTTETNPKFGQPDSVTDVNSLTTQYEYDAFGRAVKVVAPSSGGLAGAPDAYTSMQWCGGGLCLNASGAVYKIVQVQVGTPTKVSYHDSLNRVIQEEVKAFDDIDWIVSQKEYNDLGQVTFESVPHYLSAQNSFGTRYLDYDLLGRALHKTVDQTNGQVLDITYTYEQGARKFTTDIVANGRTMSRTYNGLQQLVETVDALGGVTEYAYDGAGNPIVLEDANNNRIAAQYNALGQKSWVDDPNMGVKSFTYTGFGEVEAEGDANGNNIVYGYDVLGRLETRTVNGVLEARWTYDSATYGKGLPHTESRSDAAYSRTYSYDALSRPKAIATSIDGEEFVTTTHYDQNYGRIKGLTYPSSLTLAYSYNDAGYKYQTRNAASDYSYREITDMDVWGQWSEAEMAASNYTLTRAFYTETGQMEGTMLDSLVQNHQTMAYTYDNFGNLYEQTVGIPSATPSLNTETYIYDALNRLDYSSRSDGPMIDYGYDAVGNLLKKDDFATSYSYTGGSSGGPNAVKSATLVAGGSMTYGYDANGNRTLENGVQQVWYSAHNKPTRINRNGTDLRFFYGADQMRYKQVNQTAGKTILYIDKLYEKITDGGATKHRHFIEDIAVVTSTETASGNTYDIGFTHRDRLGSVTAIVDENGNLQETHSYDPFGKPRLGNITDKLPNILESQFTTRGFTDHEHLDDVELIHMNGRAYDYNLGRFLSVDPIIQSPGNSQSLNPYSYILNNPLAGTDPSGYVSKGAESRNEELDPPTVVKIKGPGVYRMSHSNGYVIQYGTTGEVSNGSGGSPEKLSASEVGALSNLLGDSSSITFNFDGSETNGQSGEGDTNLGFVAPGAPALTPTVQTPSPTASPGAAGQAAKVGLLARLVTFVGLMSYSPGLNVGEGAQLAAMDATIESRISEAKARGEEAISLFRTAGPTEAADIRSTGVFRLGPNQFPKQFTLSLEDAQAFQASLPASGNQYSNPDYMLPHTIFTGRVSFNTFRALYPQIIADHGGTFIVTAPTTKHLGVVNSDIRRFGGIQELDTR